MKRNKKTQWILIIGIVIFLLAAISGFVLWTNYQNSPAYVFNKALQIALSTRQVELTANFVGGEEDVKYDVSNVTNPIISATSKVRVNGHIISSAGYGTLQNTYVESTSYGSPSIDQTDRPYLDVWFQIRKNGTLVPGATVNTNTIAEPRLQLLGKYIFGNFSASQRQKLLDYLKTNPIYSFSSNEVTQTTINGHAVLEYPVTLNNTNLINYNTIAATMFGIPTSDIQSVLTGLKNDKTTTTLFIDKATDHLVKVTSTEDGDTTTVMYSNYNNLRMPAEPTAHYTLEQYEQFVHQSYK